MTLSRIGSLSALVVALVAATGCAVRRAPTEAVRLAVSPTPVWKISPGDQIRVKVYREPDLTTDATVSLTGQVFFSGIGKVHVAGLSLDSLQDELQTRYERLILEPALDVQMYREVLIYGQVRVPGVVQADQGMTVLAALAKSGGSSSVERNPSLLLVKPDQRTYLLAGETRLSSLDLTHGDAIFVQGEGFFNRNATTLAAVTTMSSLVMSTLTVIFTVLR